MIHADKLEYGWWERKRGNVQLPDTLGQKNNYVLTEVELALFDHELTQLAVEVEKMRADVANTLRIRRRGKAMVFEKDPTCHTLAHVLQFLVMNAKAKLGIMHLLNGIAAKRVEMKRAAEALVRVPNGDGAERVTAPNEEEQA